MERPFYGCGRVTGLVLADGATVYVVRPAALPVGEGSGNYQA